MMAFFDFLFPPREDELLVRSAADDALLLRVSPILVAETVPPTVCLLRFDDALARAALHDAKYHGSERAFSLLSRILAEYLGGEDFRLSHTVLVPIPLSRKRERERGFNQSAEIARRAGAGLPLELDEKLLVRTRDTLSQVSLPRAARQENMRGAFGAAHPADPSYTYIVFDDVLTTGATLQAAVDALTQAGATHILPIALAH